MMGNTFKIEGGGVIGTVFILVQSITNVGVSTTNVLNYPVLVTADHVLSKMNCSNATIYLRKRDGDEYKKYPFTIPIMSNGTNLWHRHPTADVAAMRIALPNDAIEVYTTMGALAGDKFFKDFAIHPGDSLRVLGYPYGFEANQAGFPVLRSGNISSFPLTPYSKVPTFLLDFPVHEGNSGGPVYLSERRYMENSDVGSVSVFEIMGLISQQAFSMEHVQTQEEESLKRHQLGLGIVIHAQAIRETIEMLPVP